MIRETPSEPSKEELIALIAALRAEKTRAVHDEETTYEWEEYLLFNPYKGFRYLTNYNGHWNYVTPIESMPERMALGGRPAVKFEGRTFKHFSGAMADTSFVLGEFPWQVRVGEKVQADDFIDPPTVLSSETTNDEVTWSRGEYTNGADIWKAFALPGSAPRPRGVYLNQPSPYAGKVGGMWSTMFLLVAILIGLAIIFFDFTPQPVIFDQSYTFSTQPGVEPSFVTKEFDLNGRTTSLEIAIKTDLVDNWAYFNFALINSSTGDAFDFGREVSYYRDSDDNEGSPNSSVLIPSVPPGRYYLRVEPEMDTAGSTPRRGARPKYNTMRYQLSLRHGVPSYAWFWIAGFLLLIPPIVHSIRARSFETRRWADSDYPAVSS